MYGFHEKKKEPPSQKTCVEKKKWEREIAETPEIA